VSETDYGGGKSECATGVHGNDNLLYGYSKSGYHEPELAVEAGPASIIVVIHFFWLGAFACFGAPLTDAGSTSATSVARTS
jgi:hypothetical protein